MYNMFRDIPHLLGDMRSRITPESVPADGMPAPSGTNMSAPVALSALDDSDDLYAALVEHASAAAQALDMRPPYLPCTRGARGPMGYSANTTVDTAVHWGQVACGFIHHHLDYLTVDLANDIYEDIKRRHTWLTAKYQRNAEAEQMPCRCPQCHTLAVYKKPPKEYGDPEVYHCRTCMHVLAEAEALHQCELRAKELKARRGRKRKGAAA